MRRSDVTMLSSIPPTKGISKYSSALLTTLSGSATVEALGFKSMYPELLYPGGTKDPSLKPLKSSATLSVRDFLTWYNPFGWVYAGLTFKGEVLHVQWWTYVLAPIYLTILAIAKFVRKRSIIITVHNVKPHESGTLKTFANKAVVALGDHFIIHSDDGKRDFIDTYHIAKEKVTVIPHGILLPDVGIKGITQKNARKRLAIPSNRKVVLFFGIIRDYKGLDTLLDAFVEVKKEVPDVFLVIAGKPWEDWGKYQTMIDENNLADSVRLDLKFIPEDDIEAYYTATDLVVLPYKHFDAQSGAGTLALPFGKAMIVTNTGGLPTLVNDARAIVPADDVSALADSIEKVLTSEALRKKMEKDSLQMAKSLSWETIAEQTLKTYTILKKRY